MFSGMDPLCRKVQNRDLVIRDAHGVPQQQWNAWKRVRCQKYY